MHALARFATLAFALVILIAVDARAEPARQDLARPMRIDPVRLEISDVTKAFLTAWDAQALHVREESHDGAARIVEWSALAPNESFELARRLIDRKSTDHWIWLGVLMLDAGEESLAKRAFDPALHLDRELENQIEEAKRLAGRGLDPRAAFSGEDEDHSEPDVGTTSPAPGRSTKDPQGMTRRGVEGPYVWPELNAGQLADHTARMKSTCDEFQGLAKVKLSVHETEHFLFYGDLSPGESRRWARELDRMYETLLVTLEIPEGTKLFQGKGAIFVFRERNTFLDFERRVFRNDASGAGGVNHQRNGDTFTVFFKASNDQWFHSVLIHETVHAFMYRYRSDGRLPTWANEGLADFVAGHLVDYTSMPGQYWQHARNFVAKGGDPLEIMELSYADRTWPTDDSYQVSHMLVRFMLTHRPRAFKLWIDDIKAGAEWRAALEEHFNVTPARLAQGFIQDILSERGYSRLD